MTISSECAHVSISQRISHSIVGWVVMDGVPSVFLSRAGVPVVVVVAGDAETLPKSLSYSTLNTPLSWSYLTPSEFFLALINLVTTGGPPHFIANSPIPARALII